MYVAQIGMQIVHTLSVSLGELDLDLTPTNPFTVQVVQSVLCIPHIFKRAVLLRPFILEIWDTEGCTHAQQKDTHKKGCNTG